MGPRLFRRGNDRITGKGTILLYSFNGATSFQTWKPDNELYMELLKLSFNGATSFQTWKHLKVCHARVEPYCFNGATSFQTWKLKKCTTNSDLVVRLQWGHVFSDVETFHGEERVYGIRMASMGPRLFRRGNSTIPAADALPFPSFNGATSFQTWKHLTVELLIFVSLRFNGATSFQTWKQWKTRSAVLKNVLLQWGHVFSDVETPLANVIGKSLVALQWGHVFSDVETTAPAANQCLTLMLQWGHVFSDVETAQVYNVHLWRQRASMGPRLFRRGN